MHFVKYDKERYCGLCCRASYISISLFEKTYKREQLMMARVTYVLMLHPVQRYTNTYRVLQTIQMKLLLLWVWAERAVLGRVKTALKFKYEI